MTTVLDSRYRINGLLPTENTVMDNMTQLCNAAGAWLTYDIHDGKWSFVINKEDTTVAFFDDSNIIGAITVSGTGLTDLYNRVRVEFPHRDLRDQIDYVEIEIPAEDRNANEPDNTLEIKYDIINDPVQAELLGFIELKQSRVDKVIRFQTDFSQIGLKAGDIIEVYNTAYGFDNKKFRVVTITEIDTDDGAINLDITALEYDVNVYDESDLYRYERTNSNGIRAIGSIDTPSSPTITAFQANARPHILIEATSPDGTVNEIEYWISKDNSTFTYVGSQKALNGNVYSSGEQVEFDYDQGTSGNIYAKVRAKNATTTSEFSNVANLTYSPVQTTNAVDANTAVNDSGGNNLLTALALTTLLSNLDGLFNANSAIATQSGGLYDTFLNVFQGQTGVDLGTAGGRIMISDSSGVYTATGLAQTGASATSTMYNSPTFVASRSTTYKIDSIFDQDASGAAGGRGTYGGWAENTDIIGVRLELVDVTASTLTVVGASGGAGAQYWTDFAISNTVSLTAGHTYRLVFGYTNYTESNPTATASFTMSWNVYTVS